MTVNFLHQLRTQKCAFINHKLTTSVLVLIANKMNNNSRIRLVMAWKEKKLNERKNQGWRFFYVCNHPTHVWHFPLFPFILFFNNVIFFNKHLDLNIVQILFLDISFWLAANYLELIEWLKYFMSELWYFMVRHEEITSTNNINLKNE